MAVALGACARSTPSNTGIVPVAAESADSIALVQAAGRELHRSFAMLPVLSIFVARTGAPLLTDTHTSAIRSRLADALAQSAGFPLIQPLGRPLRSGEASRALYALVGLDISTDTAYVDFYSTPGTLPGAAYHFATFRLSFQRTPEGWKFKRRDLLLAS
jgi:hypothetical protein